MYDSLLMQYGLYSIAIKVMMQLVNGLKNVDVIQPYAYNLKSVLGLSS